MKFAKELEQDLVPEWRAKYFDYKTGKKRVKAVARAMKHLNQTPKTPGRQIPSNILNNAFHSPIRNRASNNPISVHTTPGHQGKILSTAAGDTETRQTTPPIEYAESPGNGLNEAPPVAIPGTTSPKAIGDGAARRWDSGDVTNYGSFIPSPASQTTRLGPPALILPDPALPADEDGYARHNRAWRQSRFNPIPHNTPPSHQVEGTRGDAYDVGKTHPPAKIESSQLLPKHKRFLKHRRAASSPWVGASPLRPQLLRRIFSSSGPGTPAGDVPLEAYKEYEIQQAKFFAFLDDELEKIESFYRSKEKQANKRLQVLRDQLHEMRDRRLEEIRQEQEAKEKARRHQERVAAGHEDLPPSHSNGAHKSSISAALKWMQPIESAIGIGPSRVGKTSKALQDLSSPSGPVPHHVPGSTRPVSWQDFTKRLSHSDDVTYRSAKRKLKLALQEFYRGLELLKSYVLLNRTAFRKINKKYDKVVKARPTGRYMSEKVNKAWFVQSEVLDGHIVAVEDLYARYFERGNHKVAVGKLRSKTSKATDFSGSVFRNGMLLAGGAVFGIQGVVYGAKHLANPNSAIRTDASYLLQIYGGYFLMLFLFLIFCLDCKIWTSAKINYPFIFEFDVRHNLDWHQLSELPCMLLFLLGLFVWLNFQQAGANAMFLYWPVILIGVSVVILFFPGPILYHKSREWWAYSNFRLLLAGIYPVEFRDFFLGDMYCSQTYSMGNLELFFCLYAHDWNNPAQCNSNHSRLLGFFSTVPGIWRALQCLRRYYDTRNAFPHLVNCGKYTFTIVSYMALSLYRIDKSMSLKALFIACSTINSIYCSVWDLAMDWSLCNPYAEYPFLRDVLGYKRPWVYYLAMILDPVLRFNWIFYAIYSNDLQHSALLSFFVGFSEVCRRGMWCLFRVENEHCTNVGRFRASRDVPLPYDLPSPCQTPSSVDEMDGRHDQQPRPFTRRNTYTDPITGAFSTNLEALQQSPRLRRRATLVESDTPIIRGIVRVGTAINRAHAQDFERRRRPVDAATDERGLGSSPHHEGPSVGLGESSDEEEYEEMEDERRVGEGPVEVLRREEEQEDQEQEREDMLAVEDVVTRRRSAVQ
ncbi:MAG: hypothetical protein Q9217_004270 [Psora testacea]